MGPRSHTRLARLLRQLRQATPEQLEAIERILAGRAVPERLRRGQPRYALHREGPLWRLRFDEGQAILKHEQGICYVAEMLSHPRERVKKLNLAAKYSSPRSPGGGGIEIYDPATGQDELPASLEFTQALAKVQTVISFASFYDETSLLADYVFPDHTGLESWGYQKVITGADRPVISGAQPVVVPY